jgi:hypothetical protein
MESDKASSVQTTDAAPPLLRHVLLLLVLSLLGVVSFAVLTDEDGQGVIWLAYFQYLAPAQHSKSTWVEAGLQSTVSAGVWAAPQRGVQRRETMRVEPGNDVDEDEWRFLLGADRAICKPELTEEAWLLRNCKIAGKLSSFEATVSRQAPYDLKLTIQDQGSVVRRLEMSKIADKYWH